LTPVRNLEGVADHDLKVHEQTRSLAQQYGRLRDVVQGPDGEVYILSSNLDGRGTLTPDGDRVLRLSFVTS
jgi:aldose sugar dehydrogenase